MEKVLCHVHGSVCMLKTGLREGPSQGRSFYVCVDKQGCDFSHVARIPPSHCLLHEDSMVELQALSCSLQQQSHRCGSSVLVQSAVSHTTETVLLSRLFFRCIVGKKAGQKWCGNVPWTPEEEKRNPLSDTGPQRNQRNPFRAPGKADSDSEWRRQRGGGGEGGEAGPEAAGRERHQKENVEEAVHSHRGKPLPPGMKMKKRVSDEEENRLAAGSGEVLTENQTEENQTEENQTEENQTEQNQTEEAVSTSSGEADPASWRPPKASPPPQQEEEDEDEDEDEEDDDVVVVSVKPATHKTPPAAAVQKTLTAFAGFQPAWKVKGQPADPRELQGRLTAQLQQRKVNHNFTAGDVIYYII
ncbi:Transcription termination factor 2 [Liparis tanakae]|uniref:Transcription termination factor 2 n=1 Tax=Liparis tanakae TaxID=230148 RepID=A0A4Z2H6Q3_9TELE|nr:Transcription termination factor 2 [Liparis tanakae]